MQTEIYDVTALKEDPTMEFVNEEGRKGVKSSLFQDSTGFYLGKLMKFIKSQDIL
jgi:hypothetical protein